MQVLDKINSLCARVFMGEVWQKLHPITAGTHHIFTCNRMVRDLAQPAFILW